MDNTINCPVCGELAGILLCDIDEFVCRKCGITGNEKMWKSATQLRRDFVKAIDGLKWIANNRLADNPVRVEERICNYYWRYWYVCVLYRWRTVLVELGYRPC